ncbi:hypothetical protein NEMIN01_1176 [Nematocida minor]|uniref:uncharacterized protein n=1 Tax=Nematocida minor TaxID=1912983 RepID=UPI00222030F1|nr:uncharacterized protein NEMIN01_1176 [Nematocida minor]KAI5190711.1 hypothetical protein NEMIN01_1176 [Nematocida minor]
MACGKECMCLDALPAKSLFSSIDINKVSAINERVKESCANVLNRSSSERETEVHAYSKDKQGLVIKIPFICKVALSRIEIRTSFKKIEVFTNNQYVTLTYKPKNKEEYSLPGTDHILPIVLPAYKHKSVDTLTLRLTGTDEPGVLKYLCICGAVSGVLPKAVNVTYELYPMPEDTKAPDAKANNMEIYRD